VSSGKWEALTMAEALQAFFSPDVIDDRTCRRRVVRERLHPYRHALAEFADA